MREEPQGITFRNASGWAALTALAGLAACAAAAPTALHVLTWHDGPPLRYWLCMAAFVAMAIVLRHFPHRGLAALALAVPLAIGWVTMGAQPLGDHDAWRNLARRDVLSLSEPLANLAYRVAYLMFAERGPDWVAPVFGVWTVIAWLSLGERLGVTSSQGQACTRILTAATFVASGLPVLFFRGYVENAFLSLPPLLHGLAHLHEYSRRGADRGDRSASLLRSGLWLTFAGLVHGVSVPSMIAALCCVAFVHWRARDAKSFFTDFGTLAVAMMLGVGATLGALHAAGFELHEGHALGGADQSHFTPLTLDGNSTNYEFAMFDHAHFVDVGNIVLFTMPLLLALLPLVWNREPRREIAELLDREPAYGIAAFGAISCTFVFGFDLRFPLDYDLMTVMPTPALLLLLRIATGSPRLWRSSIAACVVGGVHCVLVTGSLIVGPEGEHPLGAKGAGSFPEADTLTLNGHKAHYAAHPGETLVCQLRPPASAPTPFALYVHIDAVQEASGGVLCFPSPMDSDWNPSRTLAFCDGLALTPGAVAAAPMEHTLTWSRLPLVPGVREVVVQALLRDADGSFRASNAVVVRMP